MFPRPMFLTAALLILVVAVVSAGCVESPSVAGDDAERTGGVDEAPATPADRATPPAPESREDEPRRLERNVAYDLDASLPECADLAPTCAIRARAASSADSDTLRFNVLPNPGGTHPVRVQVYWNHSLATTPTLHVGVYNESSIREGVILNETAGTEHIDVVFHLRPGAYALSSWLDEDGGVGIDFRAHVIIEGRIGDASR